MTEMSVITPEYDVSSYHIIIWPGQNCQSELGGFDFCGANFFAGLLRGNIFCVTFCYLCSRTQNLAEPSIWLPRQSVPALPATGTIILGHELHVIRHCQLIDVAFTTPKAIVWQLCWKLYLFESCWIWDLSVLQKWCMTSSLIDSNGTLDYLTFPGPPSPPSPCDQTRQDVLSESTGHSDFLSLQIAFQPWTLELIMRTECARTASHWHHYTWPRTTRHTPLPSNWLILLLLLRKQ